MLRGPVVGDVAAHVALRWRGVTGERLAVSGAGVGEIEARIVATVPERLYRGAWSGSFRILGPTCAPSAGTALHLP